MTSGLLFLLLLGIGGNVFCEAARKGSLEERAAEKKFTFVFTGFWKSCPPLWSPYKGRCYIFKNSSVEWADAEKTCNSLKGHLTSIQDSDQYQFIRHLIFRATGSNTKTWVGGTNALREDLWMWTDGTPFTFTSWGPGEPNNQGGDEHCMDINLNGNDYVNDEDCSQQNPFVCIK